MKRLLFLILLVSPPAFAQLVAEAPLDSVKADGFHTISLPPGITGLLNQQLSNIRVLNEDSVEAPYLNMVDNPDYSNVEWRPFKMEKERKKGCCTIITLINVEKNHLDNFLLRVKNARVAKTAQLRGSDDKKTWYALVEDLQLHFGHLKTSVVTEVFDFPLSNYTYYQLTINDSTTSPLNIVGALRTHEDIIHSMFVEVPNVSISYVDSVEDHATWATVRFDRAQYVDRLEFDIQGPHLYKRRATIFRKQEYQEGKKKRTRLDELQSFDIISGQSRPLAIYAKEKELFIRVENDNNQPLQFKQVGAYQLKHYLIAWLEASHKYRLVIGEENMQAPVYDLEFFRDSIPARPAELEVGEIRNIVKPVEVSPTYFTNRNIIWIAIIVVAAVLGAMSVRMLKEKQ